MKYLFYLLNTGTWRNDLIISSSRAKAQLKQEKVLGWEQKKTDNINDDLEKNTENINDDLKKNREKG